MANIFIIHGAYGSAEGNWFMWLKDELEKLGHHVFVPQFKTPEGQCLESWRETFSKYENYVDVNTILIGHSLGSAFLLDILENINFKVRASYFVSGFVGNLGIDKFDLINDTFVNKGFDWEKIKNHCWKFFLYASDNDPYVPFDKTLELSLNLSGELSKIIGAGHFNTDSGYEKFEMLLEDIKKEL